MTAGRGWIALALVVFADVEAVARAGRRVSVRRRHARRSSRRRRWASTVPSQFLSMLPYRGDDRRAGDHLARRGHDPPECPGIARRSRSIPDV